MSGTKKHGLGRGFASLIPTELIDESFDPTADQDERVSDLRQIKIEEIAPDPDQPRRTFDEIALDELAASIKEHGMLQPIVVRPHGGGYMIVAGERRWRAAKRAGLVKVPALVRTLTDQHKLELSLIENLQRRDLNVLETATAYLKLRDQFNLTLDQISERVGGRSTSAISNTLRLLRLPASVREAIVAGKLTEGQARPLINLDEKTINQVLPKILKEEWSSRMVEQYLVDLKNERRQADPIKVIRPLVTSKQQQSDISRFEKRFKTPFSIRSNAKGAGHITIRFKNEAEYQRIAEILRK